MPVEEGNLKAGNLKVPNLRYRRDFAAGNHLRRLRDRRVIWLSAQPNLLSLKPTSFGECLITPDEQETELERDRSNHQGLFRKCITESSETLNGSMRPPRFGRKLPDGKAASPHT